MSRYHLTLKSENRKTGPIPVTMSSPDTCPSSCGFNGHGCYAQHGPLSWLWRKLTTGGRGLRISELAAKIRSFPAGQVWRHNQAGDLPGKNKRISWWRGLRPLVRANKAAKARGFTFTHKPVLGSSFLAAHNRAFIQSANRQGFAVNLSADNLSQADDMIDLGIAPVTAVVPSKFRLPIIDGYIQSPKVFTPKGRRCVVCPTYTHDNVTCESCALCAWAERKVVVLFPAHGVAKNKVSLVSIQGERSVDRVV